MLSCDSIYMTLRLNCLNFLSCVKNTSKFIENKNSTSDSEDCIPDEENDPTKMFESFHLWQRYPVTFQNLFILLR